MSNADAPPPPGTPGGGRPEEHRIGWDGVTFCLPPTWNVSEYAFSRNLTKLEIEDDYQLRMEIEWTRTSDRLNAQTIQERYDKQAKKLVERAEDTRRIEGLPPGWSAFQYKLAEKRRTVVAFHLDRRTRLFVFVRLYYPAEDKSSPMEALQLVASTLEVREKMLLWSIYDLSFELPATFTLLDTSLEAGRKLLTFRRGLRKFYIWHFSLADLLLKDDSPGKFGCQFLNVQSFLRGPVFSINAEDQIVAKRRKRYPLGFYDEIGRWCFRYKAGWRLIPERNQYRLWCYNYRRDSDLAELPTL